MMKKMLCLLLALLMCPVLAVAEENEADTLLLSELVEWTERYHQRAMAAEPHNNPKESLTDEGYAFIYDFATIYADTSVMSQDTVINAVVITSPEEQGPRGTSIDDTVAVVLSAFYNENSDLLGSRDFAVLYSLEMMPDSYQWAEVQRDGQRIQTIQYAVHDQLTTGGDGYTDAGVIFTMEENMVSAIRVYGVESRITMDQVYQVIDSMRIVSADESYAQVPFSYNGASLAKFDGADLQFSGLDFMNATPESLMALLGVPTDDEWMEDGENGHIRTLTYEECEAVFRYDVNKENPAVYMLLITADTDFEGPRAVRIGDSFASVFNRFRNGEGAFDGMSSEVLYGDGEYGEFGAATYGANASATLRYGLVLADGTHVVLHMSFTTMTLTEIMLYIAE